MAYPTAKVEIAFNDSPYTVSPTWTDVTSDVRAFSTDRGRSDDWSPFNSYASVTLSNRDRKYDPFNTAGTYYGKLLPRRQIRITANANPGRVNLVTNPSIETNTNFIVQSGTGSSISRSSTRALFGSYSLKWDYPSTLASPIVVFNPGAGSYRIPVTAGLQYTFSVYLWTDVPDDYSLTIRWATAVTGGSLLDTTSASVLIPANTWTRYTVTGTAPAGYPYAQLNVNRLTNTVTGTTYVDGALFEQSSTVGDYFDGSFPGYGWDGTANNSTSSSVYQPVFRGFIDGFPPQWTDAGQDSTVTLSCFDAIGLLSSETLPADWARKYILSTTPVHYYPCDEPIPPFTGGTVLNDYGGYTNNLVTTATASSGSQLAVGLVNSSVKGSNAAATAVGAIVGTLPFTVSAWLSMGSPDDGITGETYSSPWSIGYDPATSKIVVINYDPVSLSVRTHTSVDAFDMSVPHMISFAFQPNTAFQLWVDGVPVTHTATNVATVFVILGDYCNIIGGEAQQIIVWQGLQTTAVIQNVYRYSTVAFAETTAARFNRIIGETSFPASLTSAPASPASTVLDITDDAPTVSSELQKVADSEFAPLFVSRSGVLTLYNQTQIRTQTRSTVNQMTVGVGGLPLGGDVLLSYDGDSMRNVANVSMSQGGVWVKKNTTSISARGAAEASVNTQVAYLVNAQAIADIVTSWGGNVYANAEPFEVVTQNGTDWATILDRELNDRITLAVQPPSGNLISIPMLLSRIAINAVPGEWRISFEGSARWAVAVP